VALVSSGAGASGFARVFRRAGLRVGCQGRSRRSAPELQTSALASVLGVFVLFFSLEVSLSSFCPAFGAPACRVLVGGRLPRPLCNASREKKRCVGGALAATSLGRAAAGRAGALSRVGLALAEAQREGGLLRRRPRHAPGHKDCRGEEKSRDATGPRAHQAASSRVAPTSLVRAAAERADAPSEVVLASGQWPRKGTPRVGTTRPSGTRGEKRRQKARTALHREGGSR
jgi:hypothetical protein